MNAKHWFPIKVGFFAVTAFVGAGLGAAESESPAKADMPPAAPDIVLVVVDSLRADHIGSYGYSRNTTPFLDSFAKESVLFRNAFSASSWTLPSVTSMFTSTTPDVHKNTKGSSVYSTNVTTIAEVLRSAGYQTVGITCNSMTSRKYGLHRGFDVYDDSSITSLLNDNEVRGTSAMAATGAATTRLAQGWLTSRRDKSKSIFLFLLYFDPHWDYIPPTPYDRAFTEYPIPLPKTVWRLSKDQVPEKVRKRTIDAYDGEILYTDNAISNLITSILSSPRGDNTLITICSDHGESFWERGRGSHGNHLYDEELHVPLIIRTPPGLVNVPVGGRIVETQVGLIDLGKTFLDFANVEQPSRWDKGTSLRPLLAGERTPASMPLVFDLRIAESGVRRAVRTPEFKVISDLSGQPIEIYSLADDLAETNNLARGAQPIPVSVSSLIPLLMTTQEDF